MTTVIIPAHDEERVIGRCLAAILGSATPDEFEVLVVTNGCTDRTAEIAASYAGVRVVDCPVASKPAALNLGDAEASSHPRIYVDADVVVHTEAVRAVARALQDGTCHVAAPRLQFDLDDRSPLIRWYYQVWTSLPFVRDDHVGSGFYGLSREARESFAEFPDSSADDLYVRTITAPADRRCLDEFDFVVHPPYSVRSMLRIRTRMFAANERDAAGFGPGVERVNASDPAALLRLARTPSMAPKVGWYLACNVVAKARARWRNTVTANVAWDRDDSARTRAA